ncbi:hypothetical protein HMPREF1214_02495 [Bacteroides sp. HPS0048]|uniref:hypothetical protein n=1 Tax=Bacteroides sp. HPS0048 TaxID=1078089 RepID=UPI00035E1B4D|nr:hypothetical protein [Bacteroides sp. HPS0048]EOA57462.1 hypothetical protein HMPREF1214_02495 [Bacteroides sp. HPS0048]
MTKVKGGVPIRRVPRTPSVVIQAGQRVFHKLSDGTYEPATITLEAVVQNVDNPKYQWGRIVGGSFRPYSVVYSHMIASPVHAGVVAVKVTGDNVPNAIIASEVLTIVEDGVSPVQYKVVVKQLDRIVTSISCDANGNPKLYYQATAYLYKITGNTEVLCEDFYCVVVYYKNGTQSDASVSTSPSGSYTFDVSGDYDLIHVGFIDPPSGKVIIDTGLAKVYDGAPAVQYSIDILQNGKPVNTIASDAEGSPKLEPTAFARLYKKVGNGERTICSDFYCKVVSMNTDVDISSEEESGVPVSDYEFEVADNYYDSFAVSFFDKASKKTVAEITALRTYDGTEGKPGENGIPGCAIRRSEWKSGIEYRNDEGLKTVNTRYIDTVLVRAKNALGWRGYKCLQTHVSTNDNAPGNTDYWEEFPTNTVGILASLIIARDAKLDFLSGNEIRILDANDKVTAGVSGSGSGDSGIRFYAGSDNPQTAPFRVDENGKFVAVDGEFKGKVTADSGEIGGFSITNSSVGSDKNGDKMVLTRNGLTFKGGTKNVGIGDTLPDSTGASNMVAGVFETKIDTGDIQQTGLSTLYAKTSGGMRGVAISAVTDDRDKDIAISFKGGINTNGIARKGESYGDLGLTGVYTIEKAWHAAANRWAKTSFHFVDGILVRVYFDTPY